MLYISLESAGHMGSTENLTLAAGSPRQSVVWAYWYIRGVLLFVSTACYEQRGVLKLTVSLPL